jgi:hypothetical protein
VRVSKDTKRLSHSSIAWNPSLLGAAFFIPVSKILLGFQEDLAVVMQEWLVWENPSMEKAAGEEISGSFRRQANVTLVCGDE